MITNGFKIIRIAREKDMLSSESFTELSFLNVLELGYALRCVRRTINYFVVQPKGVISGRRMITRPGVNRWRGMGVDLLTSRNRSDDAGAGYPCIGFERFPLSPFPARGLFYYNISFAPTRKNHRPVVGKWRSEVIFLATTITTRNYVIRTINNSRDLSIRNGFQKLSRYDMRDAVFAED